MLHQTIRVLGHVELVCFFLRHVNFASAVGALAVHELGFGEERFTGGAVPAFVLILVDVALVVHLLENLLDSRFVVIVGGADEVVVIRIHEVPDVLDLTGNVVNVLLGRDTGFESLVFDLLTVFVGTGAEEYVITARLLVACNGVGRNDFVGVADMRLGGRIGNRRSDIILFSHDLLLNGKTLFIYKRSAQTLSSVIV